MANELVNLLKKAVGLPTGKSGSCCTPVQAEQATKPQDCCTPAAEKADPGACSK